jgi:hypothetical protein
MLCDLSAQKDAKITVDELLQRFLGGPGDVDYKELLKRIADIFCDETLLKQSGDIIEVLYNSFRDLTKDDLNEIISAQLCILKDISMYEGTRDIVHHVLDLVCDISVYDDAKELVDTLLGLLQDLPEYEVIKENIGILLEHSQDLMKDLPSYDGVVEIIYELDKTVRNLPMFDSLAGVINLLLTGRFKLSDIAGIIDSLRIDGSPAVSDGYGTNLKMVSSF